jgi:hypothetical protein
MAFDIEDFQYFINGASDAWEDEFNLNPPDSSTPDPTAVRCFSSYSATPGVANLSVATVINWLSHPYPGGGVNWFPFDLNGTYKVCSRHLEYRWSGSYYLTDTQWNPNDNPYD